MGGSAESACVAPDVFVRGAPRASLWRGALPSHDSICAHFGCRHAPPPLRSGVAGRTKASVPTQSSRLPLWLA